jgi:DNA polymerase-3 subunit epsilon
MINRYIAFDVETPNRYNNRMSAIGITVIEEGMITDSFFSFVDPLQPFDWFNTQLTGINEETVFDAPTFPELWPSIEPILSSGILVAHNLSFDMGVLRCCLRDHEIEWKKSARGICTVRMGRSLLPQISHKLNCMCDYYGIELNHHQADSDSRACAEILLRYIADGASPEKYIRNYSLDY